MNRLLVTTAISCFTAFAAFGQGRVIFSNVGGQPVLLPSGANLPAGTTYLVGLYFGPLGTQDDTFTMIGAAAQITLPGFFSGGARTVPGQIDPGGLGLFQVRAWTRSYGSTYEEVLGSGNPAAAVGKSSIMLLDTGDPTQTPGEGGPVIGDYMQSFYVTPVPEPSVICLGLFSVATLLSLHGRKLLAGP